MKIVLVQALPIMLESYQVLAASLKDAGFDCEVYIEAFDSDMITKIVESGAGLIGLNCLTGSYEWALNIAAQIKKRCNIQIMLGGCHPTFYAEEIDFNIIDILCIGESEIAIVELSQALKDGRDISALKNIVVKKDGELTCNGIHPLVKDIDDLSHPDIDVYNKYPYFLEKDSYHCRVTRSCPYSCSFCFAPKFKELYAGENMYREHSVDYVMTELHQVKRVYKNLAYIHFADEIFGLNKKMARDLLHRHKREIGLPYTVTTRAHVVDEDFAELLQETGCSLVSMSVETGNERIRTEVMNKPLSNEAIINAGRLLHARGIRTRVNCIFCVPDETVEDAFSNIALMKKMQTEDPVGFLLQPFPGTPIHKYALDNGYLEKDMTADDLDPLCYFYTPIKMPHKNKILVIQRLFVYGCKVPGFDRLLRLLIYLPNNFIFDFMHKVGIALSHKQFYKLSWPGLIRYLWSARKLI